MGEYREIWEKENTGLYPRKHEEIWEHRRNMGNTRRFGKHEDADGNRGKYE